MCVCRVLSSDLMILPLTSMSRRWLSSNDSAAAAADAVDTLLSFPWTLAQNAASWVEQARVNAAFFLCMCDLLWPNADLTQPPLKSPLKTTMVNYVHHLVLTSSSGPTSSLFSTSLVCCSKMSRLEGTLGACRCCSLSLRAALLARRAWHSLSSVERVAGQPLDPDATPHPLPWDFTGLLPLTGSSWRAQVETHLMEPRVTIYRFTSSRTACEKCSKAAHVQSPL